MYVHRDHVEDGEITDHNVLYHSLSIIDKYYQKLNRENISSWTVKEVIKFVVDIDSKTPFYPFCKKHINKLINNNQIRNAECYETALHSFKKYFGDNIHFQDITSKDIQRWIDSLSHTNRAKQQYPTNIKAMFEAGRMEYNNYDKNIIKIPNQPFYTIIIPRAEEPEKRSISVSNIRTILSAPTPTKRSELAKDIATIILYLAGINTVDLYHMKKENFVDGKLCYNRRKTMNCRTDKAYIEIKVHDDILLLFQKYCNNKDNNKLFDFGYTNERNFNKNVNKGLKQICESHNIATVTTYSFRHSWATVARNDCKASLDLIGMCLNHASEHKVTDLYIRKQYDQIDKLNSKVIKFIFK
jgi:integrase